jgi:hypothetical protein
LLPLLSPALPPIDGDRLWRRLEDLAEFTRADMPWTRRAFSADTRPHAPGCAKLSKPRACRCAWMPQATSSAAAPAGAMI